MPTDASKMPGTTPAKPTKPLAPSPAGATQCCFNELHHTTPLPQHLGLTPNHVLSYNPVLLWACGILYSGLPLYKLLDK